MKALKKGVEMEAEFCRAQASIGREKSLMTWWLLVWCILGYYAFNQYGDHRNHFSCYWMWVHFGSSLFEGPVEEVRNLVYASEPQGQGLYLYFYILYLILWIYNKLMQHMVQHTSINIDLEASNITHICC